MTTTASPAALVPAEPVFAEPEQESHPGCTDGNDVLHSGTRWLQSVAGFGVLWLPAYTPAGLQLIDLEETPASPGFDEDLHKIPAD
jgi:hypothetical protein